MSKSISKNNLFSLSSNPANPKEEILSFPSFITQELSNKDMGQLEQTLKKLTYLLTLDFAKKIENLMDKHDFIYLGGVNQYNDEGYDNSFYAYGLTTAQHEALQEGDNEEEEDFDNCSLSVDYHPILEENLCSKFDSDAEYSSELSSFNFYSKANLIDFYEALLGKTEYEAYRTKVEKFHLEDTLPKLDNEASTTTVIKI